MTTSRSDRTRPARRRRLSPAQQRLLAYLDVVGAATVRGLYHAGVSDATSRTLNSLTRRGLVERLRLSSGLALYALTPAGRAEVARG
ncbi:MAG TPA: hypothetical protein VFS08_06235 [Gemmatimonadaceae bacterium]|nr:hypothetical protein [Gemmatimonadaceae bacterium]